MLHIARLIALLAIFFSTESCEKKIAHKMPYQDFYRVGFWGHGRGLANELSINIWHIERRCDSCHAVSKDIHDDDIGTCNSCHQFHPGGWKHTLVAIDHDKSLFFTERKHHRRLKCEKCHTDFKSRKAYKEQIQCISCHAHNEEKTVSHHDLMDEFDMDKEYEDKRCLYCHAKTKMGYLKYYNPHTNEVIDY